MAPITSVKFMQMSETEMPSINEKKNKQTILKKKIEVKKQKKSVK